MQMLSRAEKRRMARERDRAQKTYTLTQNQIDQLKKEATLEATKKAFIIILGFPMLALRDQFGFGKKRLNEFMGKMLDIYDAYEEGYITLEDLHETINKETGVKIAGRIPK